MFGSIYFARSMFTGAFFAGGGVGASASLGQIPFLTPYFTPGHFARGYFAFAYFGGGVLRGAFRVSWSLPGGTVIGTGGVS